MAHIMAHVCLSFFYSFLGPREGGGRPGREAQLLELFHMFFGTGALQKCELDFGVNLFEARGVCAACCSQLACCCCCCCYAACLPACACAALTWANSLGIGGALPKSSASIAPGSFKTERVCGGQPLQMRLILIRHSARADYADRSWTSGMRSCVRSSMLRCLAH
jgi:hypothetical protein